MNTVEESSTAFEATPEKANKLVKAGEPSEHEALHARLIRSIYVWEAPIRIFHWVNAASIMLLMLTGIYIGHPFFTPENSGDAYSHFFMGWVRDVHFFTAFIFTANLIYRFYWTFKGNHYAKSQILQKNFWLGLIEVIKGYLFLPNHKPHYIGHNPLAQLSYWIFIGIGSVIMVLTGYFLLFQPQPDSIYGKSFAWVLPLFGGNDYQVRSWHHLVAWGFMLFVVVHVYMSIREDWLSRNGTMSSIFTGYKFEPAARAYATAENRATVSQPEKVTVLGIGNTLYSDDGLGLEALPELQKALADFENIEIVDGSTEGMQLLGPVEATNRLIVVDAINADTEPGTVIELTKEEIPSFNGIKMSVHQIGFQEVISAAQLRDRLPEKMVMIGLQPASLELNTELTDKIHQSLPELVQRVRHQIENWRSE
ncbi:Ni/Fe-hydrogenase, b-type cytochrome subunit [Sporolactobacillus spathodeae]|uniref:Ni/Fe-hydrogenase b-type cytochrome subunit/hydrogenase expression/formation protein n=1 Tax=Sporolactobacillus spathodeae TaxID=1465502 RepID=A0ABS2Q5X0_9BACL|nr:Ni/Fe-hydrogenase b-type cytochrome subunit/hydrogenase expression/formation protein [Sporolactobacillus spathodeae]